MSIIIVSDIFGMTPALQKLSAEIGAAEIIDPYSGKLMEFIDQKHELEWLRKKVKDLEKLQEQNKKLKEQLGYAANQLEGVSVAIEAHGQNINVEFFIREYLRMAEDKRAVLKELEGEG